MTDETVVEKDKAAPEGEAKPEDAQEDDLDSLLAEFSTDDGSKPEPEAAKEGDEDVSRQMKQLLARERQRAFQEELGKIKGDLEIDDDLLSAWIDVQARNDPRIVKAYNGRHNNPKGWGDFVKVMNKRAAKAFPNAVRVDDEETEVRKAVTSAVRGAPTRNPEPDGDETLPDWSWSDSRFETWLAQQKRKG